MKENNFFNDLMESLHEVEEHLKGNIHLKSTVIEIPDDELSARGEELLRAVNE
jgi:hypothetical protein